MKVYRADNGIVYIALDGVWYKKEIPCWHQLINQTNLFSRLIDQIKSWDKIDPNPAFKILPPIDRQELWAAGVTYLRSKEARVEESKTGGGANFYDRVYDAERPELFFKATPERTVGHLDTVYIRRDSNWNVPEPELTLFISSIGTIEGYTIGNDMGSRSIEGENPLYLTQAKIYERSASLGPCLYLPPYSIPLDTSIEMNIFRNTELVYEGAVQINQMKRTFDELVEYLFRECSFAYGCYLMTGTCLVPDSSFTLHVGDIIKIKIDGIGELINVVALPG